MKIPGIPYHQGKNKYEDSDGKKFAIAIHNTSNSASDTAESIYADHRPDGVSSHFYVDNDSVTQSLDTNSKAGHAGSYEGNEHAIAFEITGTNDKSREWWLANVAWDKLANVIAYILKNDPDYKGFEIRRATVTEMKANPRIKAFYGHNDMRLAWGGTTHTDPGPNFPWDKLIAEVKKAMLPKEEVKQVADLLNAFRANAIEYTDARVEAMASGRDKVRSDLKGGNSDVWIVKTLKRLEEKVDALTKKVDAINKA